MIHIGRIIERELRRRRYSVKWLAAVLHCDRTNVYKLFRKNSIDTELLLRISEAMEHDFFRYYTDSLNEVGEEEPACDCDDCNTQDSPP